MSFSDRMEREWARLDAEEPLTPMSRERYAEMMKEIHTQPRAEFDPFAADEQASQAFIEAAGCGRWGRGDDKCTLTFEHLGPCVDASGRSTLTLAADILRGRK